MKDGELISYGAKSLPEGGLFSLPKLYVNGGLLIGDSAGFLNGMRLKGIHLAMKSGMLAADSIIEAFKEVESWSAEAIDSCLHTLASTLAEGNLGKVAQPVRIAVAGGPVSPPIGDTLILLGKKSTLRRLERCHEYFASTCDA